MEQANTDGLPALGGVVLDDGAAPRFGTWRGAAATTDLGALVRARGISAVKRRLSEKRWQWFGVMDEDWAFGCAVVHVGLFAQVFAWLFDRRAGKMCFDESATIPAWQARVSARPGDGRVIELRTRTDRLIIDRGRHGVAGAETFIGGSWRDLHLELTIAHEVEPITAVCPVEGGHVNITQKEAGQPARGTISLGTKRWTLSPGAFAMLDYTHGLLARDTAWRWAIGAGTLVDGRRFSFNVVDGFNDALENVLWIEGVPRHVGAASFVYAPDNPTADWKVKDQNAALDLTLSVAGTRSERIDYVAARSIYVQPIGTWSGFVDGVAIEQACGVAEDHIARW